LATYLTVDVTWKIFEEKCVNLNIACNGVVSKARRLLGTVASIFQKKK
jgi:hypothetical protein